MAFDLDAVCAEEDGQEPFTFTFGGEEFSLPPPDEIGVTTAAQFAAGDLATAFRGLLGDAQFARLDGLQKRFTAKHLVALADAWKSHYGVDPGESAASTST